MYVRKIHHPGAWEPYLSPRLIDLQKIPMDEMDLNWIMFVKPRLNQALEYLGHVGLTKKIFGLTQGRILKSR